MSDITDRYRDLNHILNRDSTNTTYKYALLRGMVEVCEGFPHLRRDVDGYAEYPMGLLVERWLFYYYPLMASDVFVPQQKGESVDSARHVRFRGTFQSLIDHYRDVGGLSAFHADYDSDRLPNEVRGDLAALLRNIRETISQMPMKHLGWSLNGEHYSIVRCDGANYHGLRNGPLDRKALIDNLGTFRMKSSLADAFELIGPLITGNGSILNAWAETTASMDTTGRIDKSLAVSLLSETPDARRSTFEMRGIYQRMIDDNGSIECVWSGRSMSKASDFEVDHVLPFSKWGNNDMWNLLPASTRMNRGKRDLVPDPNLIEGRGDLITDYWRVVDDECRHRFRRQVSASLVDVEFSDGWYEVALDALVSRCEYLSDCRGEITWCPNFA